MQTGPSLAFNTVGLTITGQLLETVSVRPPSSQLFNDTNSDNVALEINDDNRRTLHPRTGNNEHERKLGDESKQSSLNRRMTSPSHHP
jgi:hypothetical protein